MFFDPLPPIVQTADTIIFTLSELLSVEEPSQSKLLLILPSLTAANVSID